MAWMAREPSRRADPRLVLPGCRSLISVGMNYDTGHWPTEGPGYGRVARYAWGKDYHEVLGDRLKQLEARILDLAPESMTRSYVDTGPIMEKAWAQEAGLGWIGKHSNLVSSEWGSWLLLGEILTTLDLPPDESATDLCGSCSLCVQACPTGAIVEPGVVDSRRCVSYWTIEHRGGIPEPAISGFLVLRIEGKRASGPGIRRGQQSSAPAPTRSSPIAVEERRDRATPRRRRICGRAADPASKRRRPAAGARPRARG